MPLTASIDELLAAATSQQASAAGVPEGTPAAPTTTGRYLVFFKPDATEDQIAQYLAGGGTVASTASFDGHAVSFADLGAAEVLRFPLFSAALLSADAYASLNAGSANVASADPAGGGGATASVPAANPVDFIEAELFFQGTDTDPDAVTSTSTDFTWGLQATAVIRSAQTGNGIKIAVLDTGFDLNHPDFAGRTIISNSFIAGQAVQDGNGHGTHTAGTACGPKVPATGLPRYGVAGDAQMYIGKVLANNGYGTTSTILAGIQWALAQGVQIVSMSLTVVSTPLQSFTNAGTTALAQGTLLIAAAGNESARPGTIAPTDAPANSPTVMSVAALDSTLAMAPFSNGGKVEIAGPGVDVYSSWIAPLNHKNDSGTSMATPHVAGIAALWAEYDASLRGQALWAALTGAAKPTGQPATDVGAGLVKAPVPGGTSAP
jgi:subtilisin family serine protease